MYDPTARVVIGKTRWCKRSSQRAPGDMNTASALSQPPAGNQPSGRLNSRMNINPNQKPGRA